MKVRKRTTPTTPLTPFPRSKIAPILPERTVRRSRLLAVLDQPTPFVAVIAPTGAGKTALLADWLQARNQPLPIWYTLDDADRAPLRLLDGLAAASERACPGSGLPTRALLTAGNVTDAQHTLIGLWRQPHALRLLVIDDCHLLTEATEAEHLLIQIINQRPPAMRVLFAGHFLPGTIRTHLTHEQVTTVGLPALAFTLEETKHLLQLWGGDPQHAADLLPTTDGWAAALELLIATQDGRVAMPQHPQEVNESYLLRVVLDRQTPEIRQFILESAPLGTLSADEVRDVLHDEQASQHIATLRERSLFVEPLGDYTADVRYLPWFAAVVERSLRAADPTRWEEIHRQAAMRRNAKAEQALHHWAALGDTASLAAALAVAAPNLAAAGDWAALRQYASLLNTPNLPDPVLCPLGHAHGLHGDWRQAHALADMAYERARISDNTNLAREAQALRTLADAALGRHHEAIATYEATLEPSMQDLPTTQQAHLLAVYAQSLLRIGQVERASSATERLRLLLTDTTLPSAQIARSLIDLGNLHASLGDHLAARYWLNRGAELAQRANDRTALTQAQLGQARLLLAAGDAKAALTLTRLAQRHAREINDLPTLAQARELRAWSLWRIGDLATARQLLDDHDQPAAAPDQGVALHILRALLALISNDFTRAHTALRAADGLVNDPATTAYLASLHGALELRRAATDESALAATRRQRACILLEQAATALRTLACRPALTSTLLTLAACHHADRHHAAASAALREAATLAAAQPWVASIIADWQWLTEGTGLPPSQRAGRPAGALLSLFHQLPQHYRTQRHTLSASTLPPERPAQLLATAETLLAQGNAAEGAHCLDQLAALWSGTDHDELLGRLLIAEARLAALRGQHDHAAHTIKEARLACEALDAPQDRQTALALACDLAADRGDHPYAQLLACELEHPHQAAPACLSWNATRARLLAALATRRKADIAAQLLSARTHWPQEPALQYFEARAALRLGSRDAPARLITASRALEELGWAHLAAELHLLLANTLLQTRGRRRAQELVNHTATLITACGATGGLRLLAPSLQRLLLERATLTRLTCAAATLLEFIAATATPHSLRISPFGAGAIFLDQRTIPATALRPEGRDLLFFLAHLHGPHTRTVPPIPPMIRAETLLDILWEGRGRAPLHHASAELRRVLGAHSWRRHGDRYYFALTIENDAQLFYSLANAALGEARGDARLAAARQALAMVTNGHYLEWSDAQWAVDARAGIRRRATTVALALAEALTNQPAAREEAIAACRQAHALDPLNERPVAMLVHLLNKDGRPLEAQATQHSWRDAARRLARQPSQDRPPA